MNEQNPYEPTCRGVTTDNSPQIETSPLAVSPLWRGARVGAALGGFFGFLTLSSMLMIFRPFRPNADSVYSVLKMDEWIVVAGLFLAVPSLFGMFFCASGFWLGDIVLRRFSFLRNWLR
ncbi:MAG: hypothetical protein FJ308_08975 [Planctomycetes bacterium]|nr:hypothetical protein [Planctomycetota bacterium]